MHLARSVQLHSHHYDKQAGTARFKLALTAAHTHIHTSTQTYIITHKQ